jgi:hypothetical protein
MSFCRRTDLTIHRFVHAGGWLQAERRVSVLFRLPAIAGLARVCARSHSSGGARVAPFGRVRTRGRCGAPTNGSPGSGRARHAPGVRAPGGLGPRARRPGRTRLGRHAPGGSQLGRHGPGGSRLGRHGRRFVVTRLRGCRVRPDRTDVGPRGPVSAEGPIRAEVTCPRAPTRAGRGGRGPAWPSRKHPPSGAPRSRVPTAP